MALDGRYRFALHRTNCAARSKRSPPEQLTPRRRPYDTALYTLPSQDTHSSYRRIAKRRPFLHRNDSHNSLFAMSCVSEKAWHATKRTKLQILHLHGSASSATRLEVPPGKSCVAARNGGSRGGRYELVGDRHRVRRRRRRRPMLRTAQQILLLPLPGRAPRRASVERIHPQWRRRRRHLRVYPSADSPGFARELSRRSERRMLG